MLKPAIADLGAARNQVSALLLLIAEAIDCREGLPAGNSKRVMEYAARFGEALELSADDRLSLERGALLRGIGKFQVPNSVLLKDGALTYDEWQLIQNHPNLGADLAKVTPGLEDIEDVLRSYHECFDGSGYPREAEGEDIPLLGRIVRLLDVYCAMTSPRPYRDSVASRDDALAHIQEEAGKHFDPALVAAFLEHNIAHEG